MDDERHVDLLEDQRGELSMMYDKNIVPLKPEVFNDFDCPNCGQAGPEAIGALFPGIHVLGQYRCGSCKQEFHRDLPVGFAVDHPLAISSKGKLLGDPVDLPWLTEPFVKGFKNRSSSELPIERKVFIERNKVIVLNTLDFLYGHVLLKLFNAQHYLDNHPDHGLVLLIPRMYAWLIPKDTAEAWIVDVKLGQALDWYQAVDEFVKEQLTRYDEVMLGRGYAHPDHSKIDLERYTGIPTFKLEQFTEVPVHMTIVARTDRMWFRTPQAKFMSRVLNKLGMKKLAKSRYVKAQDRLIKKTIHAIRQKIPQASFTIVGLSDPVQWSTGVSDLRTTNMSDEQERTWCRAYARSQVVIGVHGSNMLLPTAFAAGCVEILPYERYGNIVQDVAVRYNDRMQLFMYRFVDEFAGPSDVARHATSIIRDYEPFYRSNRINVF